MLTARQKQALHVIDRHIRAKGCAPSLSTLALALGNKHYSKAAAQGIIDRLIERGFLRCSPHHAIEIVRPPPDGVRYFRFDAGTKRLVEWQP